MSDWKTVLSTGLQFGAEDDESMLFVDCEYMVYASSPPAILKSFENALPVLLLRTIVVPASQRNQGLCKQVFDFLEQRADQENVLFAVGPILEADDGTAWCGHVAESRGYSRTMPWCYVRLQ